MASERTYGEDFAHVYHEGWSGFIRAEAPKIIRLLRRNGIRRGTVADLACGTGVLAAELGRAGYAVFGADASRAMLRIARRTAPKARLVHGCITSVALPRDLSAALCTFDSLNYLLRPAQLTVTFRRVARALRPGGLFLFDMNTMTGLRARWKGVRFHTGRDWFLVGELSSDARRRRAVFAMTGFRRVGGSYRLFRERHVQRGVTVAEVRACARAAGLRVRRMGGYDGSAPKPNPSRIFCAAVTSD